MTINSISKQILELAEKLEKGELHADEIIEMTELSRQLHERMIVLQYKTFEERYDQAYEGDVSGKIEREKVIEKSESTIEPAIQETAEDKPVEPQPQMEEEPESEPAKTEITPEPVANEVNEERAAFRIENSIIPSNQISLIDSIEEIREMEKSLNDAFGEKGPSLAQKLHQKPIANLKTAITINQKFKFISTLFQNDTGAFEMALDRINACATYLEADEYIQNGPGDRFEWEMKSPTVKEMMELVERRFL
ncbi:hypothetical protein G3O08_08370 [Cryomorpha ignava]|uniref:Uncharacterized protein n=1 Tax=Cryomorpha ignava TaxID=101383 RepID=A0A7K3WPD0_9FLAO|nr:hypothetical protein [Cryomorpha ignava]NEN23513.1 hypothetical protein [Cryomorpha ignava]